MSAERTTWKTNTAVAICDGKGLSEAVDLRISAGRDRDEVPIVAPLGVGHTLKNCIFDKMSG